MRWSIRSVKAIPLFGVVVLALSFGVAAASAPAPAPAYQRALWDSDDSVDLAVADFNGDGRSEIATANYNPGSVTVGNTEHDVGGLAGWIEAHDLNGDGRPDLVVEAESDTVFVAVLLNQAGGSFGAAKHVLDGAGRITVGDVTGDGKPEIVSATGNDVTVVVNKGDGTFGTPATYEAGKTVSRAAIGDVNGDGKGDIALTSPRAAMLAVLLSNGDGTFQPRADYATGPNPSTPATGDLNADGKADIAVPTAKGVSVFLANTDGTLGARQDYAGGPDRDWVEIHDLNGDGKPDLLLHGTETKTLTVLQGNGDGTFKQPRVYPTWRYAWVEAVRDVNGDGSPDVVMLAGAAQVVSVLLNRGDGTFQPKLDYIPVMDLWGGTVGIGDLNGDKRPDLVVPVGNDRNGWTYLSVFLNKPGTCNVQLVGGMTLTAAKQQLARVNCRVGKVSRVFSNWVAKGHVIAQKPRFGAELPHGTRIDLVVSKGRWR